MEASTIPHFTGDLCDICVTVDKDCSGNEELLDRGNVGKACIGSRRGRIAVAPSTHAQEQLERSVWRNWNVPDEASKKILLPEKLPRGPRHNDHLLHLVSA